MIKVLIITKPDDPHAILVKLALEKKGQKCDLMYTTDLPDLQRHSFSLKNGKLNWLSKGLNFYADDINYYDVVWYRRPRRPVLPSIIHQEDTENAMNENIEFFRTLWQVISPNAFWVNPYNARPAVNAKLKQLNVAVSVGLNVPETLISNDPDQIKEFIDTNKINKVIYKTLSPMMWLYETEMRLTYTKEISIDQLPSDAMLQATPGIFQKKINKAFELRITFMGDTAVSAKIRSQEHPKGIMDWRYVPGHELAVDSFVLPDLIHRQCKKFMEKFGIVFGCFDFIVTPEEEYYFLEINEQGQFLWVEDLNPDIKMLDAFTDFLISKSADFKWDSTKGAVSSSHFIDEMTTMKEKAMEMHNNPVEKY